MPAKPTTFLLYTYYKNLMALQKWIHLGFFLQVFLLFLPKNLECKKKSVYLHSENKGPGGGIGRHATLRG